MAAMSGSAEQLNVLLPVLSACWHGNLTKNVHAITLY